MTAKPETFQIDVCKHRDAIIDYSEGVVKLFFETKGPCSTDGILEMTSNQNELSINSQSLFYYRLNRC